MSRNKKNGMSSNAKWGIALVVELLILMVMVVVYAGIWANKKMDSIKTTELVLEEIGYNEGSNVDQTGFTTIALFGIDARDTNDMGAGQRSDSIMIASINNDTKEVKIVSIYRDTLLYIPGSASAEMSDLTTKVTHAYSYGGAELALKTLNENLDLQISEFITVNFLAVTKAIDDLGGVNINVIDAELPMLNACISEQMQITGIYSDGVFETGNLLLNGTQATGYARIRSTDQGDITRTERQRTVIARMVEKAKKADFATINNIIDDVFPCVYTSITKDEMIELLKSLMSYQLGDTTGFPFAMQSVEHESKGSILVPADLTGNVSALHKFLFGTENYDPTISVKNISNQIQAETGVGAQEININVLDIQ